MEAEGYRLAASVWGALLYAHPKPRLPGMVVAPLDWPMHRLFQLGPRVGVTPWEGLTLEAPLAVREPARLEAVGAAVVGRRGGMLEASPAGGELDPWGLLDAHTPRGFEPPGLALASAALRLRPRMILLVPVYTRPHSARALLDVAPGAAAVLAACAPGGSPVAAGWARLPGWARLFCVDYEGSPGLPLARPARGALERALEGARSALEAVS